MGLKIAISNIKNETIHADLNKLPDECPICHNNIEPVFCWGYYGFENPLTQVVFKCPRQLCQCLFVSLYEKTSKNSLEAVYLVSVPNIHVKKEFDQTIQGISENFCNIYNEAFQAEQSELLQICGVGYRKALEFLIKDYLIALTPTNQENIKKKFLGKCISEDIQSENIREIARRATWLGNDETHYVRIWEQKDLKDLKRLIDITVYWIEAEEKTKEAIRDMPSN
ncbi:DUF4145 domain-containing protein [Gloeocapsopsis dulcis]|uniref:DUF4145 domain-containing protein n=1 Tax=Gloeocapsopsis dulcis AAB1 = 1H9 TaxID=1433147 RepID=A0A6N8G3Y4_9CHRO|nr:DUF4145 domain-containing protein [Gloeocapsopsis dulcis]MUL39442.1 hypothetical protein [Gloeocapsopsis dulcis AAB1 = 1H9]WNN92086.1 DUF4145 domain-containing protein [Gloeocapsopsis dulcis]